MVASEIRRLADQTAVATYDIELMVREILSSVSAGVMGMDKFTEEVRRGITDIERIGYQLSQIIQQVQALAPGFQQVNEGMQAQMTGAEQINQALGQLSEAAQQTVESLRQSSQAVAPWFERVFPHGAPPVEAVFNHPNGLACVAQGQFHHAGPALFKGQPLAGGGHNAPRQRICVNQYVLHALLR